jgi:RNA 2',3'-cyclic 3'-phosphodiesterase
MRMFVAVLPPAEALEHLAEFLEPRQQAEPGFRWTVPEQRHVTLAFMPAVADRHLDDLEERLARAAARRTSFSVSLTGGGAFPDPTRAKVLYTGVQSPDETDGPQLSQLATGARAAAAKAGAEVGGGRFHPHVTLARIGVPVEATRWVRVLDAYQGPTWRATEVTLVASHLGEGPRRRPRHEMVGTFPLGESTA